MLKYVESISAITGDSMTEWTVYWYVFVCMRFYSDYRRTNMPCDFPSSETTVEFQMPSVTEHHMPKHLLTGRFHAVEPWKPDADILARVGGYSGWRNRLLQLLLGSELVGVTALLLAAVCGSGGKAGAVREKEYVSL